MVEAFDESRHVWSHKVRTTLFLSAMRHFTQEVKERGFHADYRSLATHGRASLAMEFFYRQMRQQMLGDLMRCELTN